MYSFYVYIACGGMEIWFCHFEKKYLYEEPNYPNLLLLCLKCHFYNFSDYSLSQAFGQYLTHALGKKCNSTAERENMQDIFIHTILIFTRKDSQKRKYTSYREL